MADIQLQKPAAGQTTTITPAPEDRLVLQFDTGDATLTRAGDNLNMAFEDGSSVSLTDFYKAYTSENMPTFVIGDAEIDGEQFFAGMADDLMPAAGPGAGATPTSGGTTVDTIGGTLLGGLERLDGLDQGFGAATLLADFPATDTINTPPIITGITIFSDGDLDAYPDTLDIVEEGVGRDSTTNAVTSNNPNQIYSGDLFAQGQVNATDPQGVSYSVVGSATGTYGNFSVDANGVFTFAYIPESAHALAQDEIVTETFTVRVTDDTGLSTDVSITVTIRGTNDLPIIESITSVLPAVEDSNVNTAGDLVISGTSTITDPDNADTQTFFVGVQGQNVGETLDATDNLTASGSDLTIQLTDTNGRSVDATVRVDANGAYTATVKNGDVQNLGEGENLSGSFTFYVQDAAGAWVSQDVTVTVTGTNDQPTIEIESDATTSFLKEQGVGDQGTFSIGSWTTTIDLPNAENPDADAIATGKIALGDIDSTDKLSILIGGTDVSITVNTPYYVSPDGTWSATMPADGDYVGTISFNGADKAYDYEFTLNDNGKTVNALDEGSQLSVNLSITVKDDSGVNAAAGGSEQATNTTTLTFTIEGTNDKPVLTQPENLEINEDTASVSGTAKGTDADAEQVGTDVDADPGLTYHISAGHTENPFNIADKEDGILIADHMAVGLYGTMTIDKDSGEYVYKTTALAQILGEGQYYTEKFTVYVKDEYDAWDAKQITVKVTGSNDDPIITYTKDLTVREEGVGIGTLPNAYDMGIPVALGMIKAIDIDLNDIGKITFSVSEANSTAVTADHGFDMAIKNEYGTLHLNNTTGAYKFVLDNTSETVQAMNEGDLKDITFKFTAKDAHGGSDTQDVTVTITGTNDQPILSVDKSTLEVTDNVDNPHLGGTSTPASVSGQATATDFDSKDLGNGDAGAGYGNDTDAVALDFSVGIQRPTLDNILNLLDQDTLDKLDNILNVGKLEQLGTITEAIYNTFANLPTTGTEVSGLYGEMKIDSDGVYTYTLYTQAEAEALGPIFEAAYWALQVRDENDPALPTENFTIYVKDDSGAWSEQDVTVTVKGANDSPVIHHANDMTVQEAGHGVVVGKENFENMLDPGIPAAVGQIVATDIDIEKLTFGIEGGSNTSGSLELKDLIGDFSFIPDSIKEQDVFPYDVSMPSAYGTLYLNSTTGTYIFVVDQDKADILNENEDKTLEFTLTVDDQNDGTTSATDSVTIKVTVEGTNDQPQLTVTDNTLSINENTGEKANSVKGTYSTKDVDSKDVGNEEGADNLIYSLTITRPEQGNETLQTLVESLLGAVGLPAGSVLEGVRDIMQDLYETLANAPENTLLNQIPGIKYGTTETLDDGSQVIYGLYGKMVLSSTPDTNGDYPYTYTLYTWDEAKDSVDTMAAYLALQHRDAGDTALPTENFTITVQDSEGAWDSQNISVTVNGINDAPIITPETAIVTEAGVGGNVGAGIATDAILNIFDETINPIVDPILDTIPNWLGGDVLETFVSDIRTQLEETINKQFESGNDYSPNFEVSGDPTAKGDIIVEDDDGITVLVAKNATIGFDAAGFSTSLISNIGDLGLSLENANAIIDLMTNGFDFEGIVNGTVDINAFASLLGDLANSIVDIEAVFNIVKGSISQTIEGKYGTLVINLDGSYTYTLNNEDPDTQALNGDNPKTSNSDPELGVENFTITAYDKFGQSTTTTLDIQVTGTNDKPVFTDDTEIKASISEDGTSIGGQVFATDVDQAGLQGDQLSFSVAPRIEKITLEEYLKDNALEILEPITNTLQLQIDDLIASNANLARKFELDALVKTNEASIDDKEKQIEVLDAQLKKADETKLNELKDALGIEDDPDTWFIDEASGLYKTLDDAKNELGEVGTWVKPVVIWGVTVTPGYWSGDSGIYEKLHNGDITQDTFNSELNRLNALINDTATKINDTKEDITDEQAKVDAENAGYAESNSTLQTLIDALKNDITSLQNAINAANKELTGSDTLNPLDGLNNELLSDIGYWKALIYQGILEGLTTGTADEIAQALLTYYGEQGLDTDMTEQLEHPDGADGNTEQQGDYGVFKIDPDNGNWLYEVQQEPNPADYSGGVDSQEYKDALARYNKVQALGEGETLTETFTIYVQDEAGAWDYRDVTVTINGTDDPPVIKEETATLTVDESYMPSGTEHGKNVPAGVVGNVAEGKLNFTSFEAMHGGMITIAGVAFMVTEDQNNLGSFTLKPVDASQVTEKPAGTFTIDNPSYGNVSVESDALTYNSATNGYTLDYTYTQDKAYTKHTDNAPTTGRDESATAADSFEISIQDGKGTAADSVTVNINIEDDAPVVTSDNLVDHDNDTSTPEVTEVVASGGTATANFEVDFGADGENIVYIVDGGTTRIGVQFDSENNVWVEVVWDASSQTWSQSDTAHKAEGTYDAATGQHSIILGDTELQGAADGTWTVSYPVDGNRTDVLFGFVDGDGDSVEHTISANIIPTLEDSAVTTYDNMKDSRDSNADNDGNAKTVTGSLAVVLGDGDTIITLTNATNEEFKITITPAGDVRTNSNSFNGEHGTLSDFSYNNGELSYKYTQGDAANHTPDGEAKITDTFKVEAIDGDGDIAASSANITVTIMDDEGLLSPDGKEGSLTSSLEYFVSQAGVIAGENQITLYNAFKTTATADTSEENRKTEIEVNDIIFKAAKVVNDNDPTKTDDFVTTETSAKLGWFSPTKPEKYEPGLGIVSNNDADKEIGAYNKEALIIETPDGKYAYGMDFTISCLSHTGDTDSTSNDFGTAYFYKNGVYVGKEEFGGENTTGGSETVANSFLSAGFNKVIIVPKDINGGLEANSEFYLRSVEFIQPAQGYISVMEGSVVASSADGIKDPAYTLVPNTTKYGTKELELIPNKDTNILEAKEGDELYFSVSVSEATGDWVVHQYKEIDGASINFDIQSTDGDGSIMTTKIFVDNKDSDSTIDASNLNLTEEKIDNVIVYGFDGDDTITGSDGADHLFGGDGDDILHGLGGDDILFGGEGKDTILGGTGNDLIVLPKFDDVLQIDGGDGIDILLAGVETLEAAKDVLNSAKVNSIEILMYGTATDETSLAEAKELQEELAGKTENDKINVNLNSAGWSEKGTTDVTIGGKTFREFTNDDDDKMTILVNTNLLTSA